MRHAIARMALPVSVWALWLTGCAGGLDNRDAIKGALSNGGGGTDVAGTPSAGKEEDSDTSSPAGSADNSNDDDSSEQKADYPDVVEEIFKTQCTGCHGASAPQGGLDLVSPDFATRLGGKESASQSCGDALVIDLDNPEESQLYLRLLEDPECGARMPYNAATPLTEEESGWVLAWIKDGAPDSEEKEAAADDSMTMDEDTMEEEMSVDEPADEDEAQDPPSDGEALDRSDWVATSEPSQDGANAAENAIDGNLKSRFTTGQIMQGGEWLQIDMGSAQTVSRIVVNYEEEVNDRFRGYAVYVTDDPDPEQWGTAVAEGMGDESGVTEIELDEPATGQYLVIEQTGSDDTAWWSVYELNVYP